MNRVEYFTTVRLNWNFINVGDYNLNNSFMDLMIKISPSL